MGAIGKLGPNETLIGQQGSREALSTPALVLDLDRLERNIAYLADYLGQAGHGVRPVAKIHKSVEVAKRQMEAGALGQCCATLAEAEVMAHAGIPGVLLFSQVVTEPKIARLAQLNVRADGLLVAVDDAAVVDRLASRRLLGNTEHLRLFRGLTNPACGSRVAPRHPDVPVQFTKPLAHALERLLGRPQVRLALPSIQAIGAESDRLVDQQPQIGGLAAENVVGAPLLDQRVGPRAESGSGEQPPDLSPGAPPAVHFVDGLSAGVHAAADDHVPPETTGRRAVFRDRSGGAVAGDPRRRARLGRNTVSGNRVRSVPRDAVFGLPRFRTPGPADVEPHLGDPEGLAQSAPTEDELLPPRPDRAGAQLTEHPEDRVGDVALAAAVRPHHRRGALPELERHRLGKTFESGDLEPLDPHSLVT